MRRVAVTGLGVLAPNGIGTKDFAEGLWEGRSAISRITGFDPSAHASQIAGQLPDIELPGPSTDHPDGDDRVVRIALAAAAEAVAAAGLDADTRTEPRRIGTVIANAIGGTRFMTEHYPSLTRGGTAPIDISVAHPGLHRSATFNTASAAVADIYGVAGPVITLATGCTGGNDAIGFALQSIRSGETDVVIAGAAEAPITPFVLACFDVIGALSSRNDDPAQASRPFDKERDGFVLAEGAAITVLEEWERARRRGAPILAEVLGFGTTTNAFHMTDLTPDGIDLARSFQLALDDARLAGDAVGYVNAHGSSTPQNDICETNAIKKVLRDHARRTPVSSTKSMVGHALAAANALEFVASVLAINASVLPPTINHVVPDPACDLDYVPNAARQVRVDYVASLSSGFGGIHSTVVLGRAKEN